MLRTYEVEKDHAVVWVRLPKRLVPVVNHMLANQGEILAPDDKREGVDLSCVYAPAVLRQAIKKTTAGLCVVSLMTLSAVGMIVGAILIGPEWDFTFGAGVAFVIMLLPGVVSAVQDLRAQRSLARMAREHGCEP